MTTQSQIIANFKKSINLDQDIPTTNWEESDTIEFKKSLHVKSDSISKDYLKTISGFANNLGGIIVFGITPDTKELVGIKAEFENLDNRFVSTTITKSIDGSFQYSFFTTKILGKLIGFLQIGEAMTKPVILKVDSSEFAIGEIYFRYPAQTNKIFASDLRKIINDEIANRLRNTIGNISKLVEFGDSAAILNTESGEIELGNSSTKLIVDESILNRLNLIKEGHFVEQEGSPAYIIKGEIESSNIEVIEKSVPSVINESDILGYFFNSTCEHPSHVIERLIYSQSPYNPIHFFIKEAGFTKEQSIRHIENIDKPNINLQVKEKLLERINGNYPYNPQGKVIVSIKEVYTDTVPDINLFINEILSSSSLKKKPTKDQIKRTLFYNTLIGLLPIPEQIYQDEFKCIVEAFSNLKREHLLTDRNYFLKSLQHLTSSVEKQDASSLSKLRKVICFVDEVYYDTATKSDVAQ